MRHNFLRRILGGILTGCILVTATVHAGTTQKDIDKAKVVCNCGNEFVTGSTKEEIHVEICSKCHSFYTGQQKAIKARGRIDMFNKKYGVQAN